MSYRKIDSGGIVTVHIACDARKGKGVCGNTASVSMSKPFDPAQFLYDMGWRLLRGHQVCSSCLKSGHRVTFPRKAA